MVDMVHTQTRQGAAFDVLADSYDRVFTDSLVGKAQRAQVWAEMDQQFSAGQRILEINCGTGADALHLAKRGVHVTACDSSARMVAVGRERLLNEKLPGSVTFRDLPTEHIGLLQNEGPFDGALSNFAGLNCIMEFPPVARQLASLLRPSAKVLFCLFGKLCVWEMLWYIAHAEFGKAFRRVGDGVISTNLGQVRYHTLEEVELRFAPYFRLLRWRGIGVAVPPSYLEPWVRAFPVALRFAAKADSWLGSMPLARAFGDHILLTLERCPS